MLCLQIALSHFAAWHVLFQKSHAQKCTVYAPSRFTPMLFRAGENFTVFTTLDFSTAFYCLIVNSLSN